MPRRYAGLVPSCVRTRTDSFDSSARLIGVASLNFTLFRVRWQLSQSRCLSLLLAISSRVVDSAVLCAVADILHFIDSITDWGILRRSRCVQTAQRQITYSSTHIDIYIHIVCVLSSHLFWTSGLWTPAGVTRISDPSSFSGACLNFFREKDSAIPFPRLP